MIGDSVDLPTLVRAGSADRDTSMDAIDAAVAVGVLEPVAGTGDRYAFVHSITRQVVLDRLPHTRCTALHARVAQVLEAHDDPALAPRIAHHYLAAHVLGHQERARHHAVAAARQAAHSLAFEEAALWFDRAATLPETAGGRPGAAVVRGGDEPRAGGRLRPGPGDLRAVDHHGRPAGAPPGGDGPGGGRRPARARRLPRRRPASRRARRLRARPGRPPARRGRAAWAGRSGSPAARARAAGWAASRSTPPGAPATGPP